MNKFKLITFSLIIVLQVLGTSLLHKEVKAQQSINEYKQKTTLYDYLQDVGAKYNCFFTIEEGWNWTEKEPLNQLESYKIEDFAIEANIKQRKNIRLSTVLSELKKSIPNFTSEINKQNPHIIHIVDERLKKQEHYGVDSTLVNFNFKGSVTELLHSINKQEQSVIPTAVFDTYGILRLDSRTELEVKGTNLIVRDALSNFINLQNRGRVLWIARTCLDQETPTSIHFVGAPNVENN